MSRILTFLAFAFVFSLASAQAQPAAPQPDGGGVFLVRDRQGRKVYTNLDGMASHGQAVTPLALPPLSSIDFASTLPAELRVLDQRVTDSHNALQSGELCEAIRKSSRTPTWSRLWVDHGRKISVAGALFVFAGLLGVLGSGRRLGSLFPLVPFLGTSFLGYATYRDLTATRESLTAGLRACSEQLPDGDPENKGVVQGRLTKALEVQSIVNNAWTRQADEIERIMREAR